MMRLWILLLFAALAGTFGQRLSSARPDSNKVFLLLDISDAYLKANAPDSSLFYSSQAISLGQALNMKECHGEIAENIKDFLKRD